MQKADCFEQGLALSDLATVDGFQARNILFRQEWKEKKIGY